MLTPQIPFTPMHRQRIKHKHIPRLHIPRQKLEFTLGPPLFDIGKLREAGTVVKGAGAEALRAELLGPAVGAFDVFDAGGFVDGVERDPLNQRVRLDIQIAGDERCEAGTNSPKRRDVVTSH